MFCCDLNPRVIPSPEAQRWSSAFKFMAIAHVVFAILFFIGQTQGTTLTGLQQLIMAWILFVSYRTYDYCTTVLYILFMMLSFLTNIEILGSRIQFAKKFFSRDNDHLGRDVYLTIVVALTFMFYCFAFFASYRAYKEFKALAMGALPMQRMVCD